MMQIQSKCKDFFSVTVLFSFMVFIFAPFEIYLSNKEWFFFDGTEMILFSVLLFVFFILISTILLFILSRFLEKLIFPLSIAIWTLSIALYIQGNFLVVDYGIMDGTQIIWDDFAKQGLISIGIFVLILFFGFLLYRFVNHNRVSRIIRITAVCIVFIQIYTLTVLLISNNGLKREEEYVSTAIDEYNLSQEDNFIILILDTFDSAAMDRILEDMDAERYREVLSDFTYYPDTLGNYSFTDLAVPAILSGKLYYNDMTYGEYLKCVYEDSPLINKLNDDDWYCGIYTASPLANSDVSLSINNCRKIRRTVSSHRRLAEYMYRFVGFRYCIQPLKKFFWFYPEDMKTSLSDSGISGVDLYNGSNITFYNNIDSIKSDMDKKCFHLIHVDGTHPPFTLKSDFSVNDHEDWSEEGLYDAARAMMLLIDRFCNRLRDLGIYDDSAIIIMADHGYIDYRQSPVFMIKGYNERHDFKIEDSTQISYSDLQEIFLNVLSGKEADNIVNVDEGMRDRIYLYNKWSDNLGYDSYTRDMKEYIVRGDCRDLNNFTETGNVYSHTDSN